MKLFYRRKNTEQIIVVLRLAIVFLAIFYDNVIDIVELSGGKCLSVLISGWMRIWSLLF